MAKYDPDADKTIKEFGRYKLTDKKDLVVCLKSYNGGAIKLALNETYKLKDDTERQQKLGRFGEVELTNLVANLDSIKKDCEAALKEIKKAK